MIHKSSVCVFSGLRKLKSVLKKRLESAYIFKKDFVDVLLT